MIITEQVLKVVVLLLSAIMHWRRVIIRLLLLVTVPRRGMRSLLPLVLLQAQRTGRLVPLLSVMLLKGKMKMQLRLAIRQRLLRVVLF